MLWQQVSPHRGASERRSAQVCRPDRPWITPEGAGQLATTPLKCWGTWGLML